jgi:hypothetical protein
MSEQIIIDNENPNYRLINNFLTKDMLDYVVKDLHEQPEEHWVYEFEQVYPKEHEVSKDYWIGIKDWQGMSINLKRLEKLEQFGMDQNLYLRIIELAKQSIEERFSVKVVVEQALLNRWRPGREQRPHVDYILDEEHKDESVLKNYGMNDDFIKDFKKHYTTKHFSTIIYFNDDYVGGELYFPEYNAEIKPTKNSAISFKGDVDHLHGVKLIESGTRFTISLFWTEIK